MQSGTLRVPSRHWLRFLSSTARAAERPGVHSHAERGNEVDKVDRAFAGRL